MPSRAEQITAAIVEKLKTPAMASVEPAQVHRDLVRAIDKAQRAAVAVEEGDEPAPDKSVIGVAYRTLEVRVSAIAKAAHATAMPAADAILVEAHNRVMSDETLGGLACRITEGETSRQREAMEADVAFVTKTYRIEYRTGETSLEE